MVPAERALNTRTLEHWSGGPMSNQIRCNQPFFLAAAVVVVLSVDTLTVARAQDEGVPLEEIVVHGVRGSMQSQRDAKKNSGNISDSIFAEDIGRMPDENIAEALQRVTGVGIDRVNGEGTVVTIRGVDPNLNKVTLNGQTVTNGGDGNAVDLSTFSSSVLQAIEVVKTPSADHDEGSLGGTVNLKTIRPLEIANSRTSIQLQTKRNSLADENDIGVKGAYVGQFKDDTFGVAISAFYDEQTTRTDTFTSFQRYRFRNVPGTSLQTGADMGTVSVQFPEFLQFELDENARQRTGLSTTLQYRPSDETNIWLDLSYSELEVERLNNMVRLNAVHSRPVAGTWLIDEETGTAVTGTGGNTNGNHIGRDQKTNTDSTIIGLGLEQQFGDWTAEFAVGLSRAEQTWPRNRRLVFPRRGGNSLVGGFSLIDLDGNFVDVPSVSFDDRRDPLDPDAGIFSLTQVRSDNRAVSDDEDSFSVDFRRDLNLGAITGVEFGAKYFERSRFRTQTNTNVITPTDNVDLTDPGVALPFPVSGFLSGISGNTVEGWLVPDMSLYDSYFPADGDDQNPINQIGTYSIEQEALAGYVKFPYSAFGDRFFGDFGVRVVSTDSESVGTAGIRFPGEAIEVPFSGSNSYDNVLPSFNGIIRLSDDMILRLGAAAVMARPSYNELRPGIDIQNTNLNESPRASGGNPSLDPTEANQFDLSWEWYFGETGLLSAAWFYKDIDTFVFTQTGFITDVPVEPQFSSNGLLLDSSTCTGADPYDASTCEVALVSATLPLNGEGGTINGIELAYQQDFDFLPGFLSDTGLLLNYTYVDSEATFYAEELGNDAYDGLPFPNTSEHTYNVVAFWQKEEHSVRLAYNSRSDRLITPSVFTNSIWAEARESLDFSASFELGHGLTLNLQALNLTEDYDRLYVTQTLPSDLNPGEGSALSGGVPTYRTAELRDVGRIYRIGLTARFD